MLMKGFEKNFNRMIKNDKRPFSCMFKGEGASDCGGPMRDLISNVCSELMSDVLPLLIPSGNNTAKVEPCTDCYVLNPNATEPFVLRKFTFLGYFLGWSLRAIGNLMIDLTPAFWNRVCGGSTYSYTIDDVRTIDLYRANMLTEFSANFNSDEEFNAKLDGYD